MSENAAPADDVTAGKLLREAREASGMHLDTLAANLKVPPAKLGALENDRYDLLPDAVFVRALASSVCRTLKMDPQPVLQRLPQTGQPRLVQDHERINAPFRSPNDGPAPGWLDHLSRPVVLTVAALLLGALVLVFLPLVQRAIDTVAQANRPADPVMPPPGAAADVPSQVDAGQAPVLADAASSALPAAMPASAAGAAPTAAAITPAPDANAVPTTTGPGQLATPSPQLRASTSASVLPAAAPAATASAQAAPGAAQAAASAPIAARGVIVFRTRGPSWVQVTDANGTTVLRKLMEAGESAGASGALPLTVTVGSAEVTDVQVRGKPYNLAPVSRDNVARFEVK